MHRPFFPFIFVAAGASLLFACGIGASQAGNPDKCPPGLDCPVHPQPVPDAGVDAQPTCESTAPGPVCTGCNGEPISGECFDGVWSCPELGCPIEIDAGCSGGPVPACPAPSGSCGPYYQLECVSNQWTCVDVGGACFDAGPDSPIEIYDASPQPPFACGNLGCDPSTSYCQITTGGPVDAGNTTFACDLLPSACGSGPATCACIGLIGQGCACVEQHGDVTLTCELP
jgi:hypothetical protein